MNSRSITGLLSLLIVFNGNLFAQQDKESDAFTFASKLYNDRLYDVAIAQLEQLLEEFPSSRFRLETLELLGNSYFNLRNYADSRRVYLQLEKEYHGAQKAEEALMLAAKSSEELNDYISAAVTFKKLTSYYPNSSNVESAYLASGYNYLLGGMDNLTESILLELIEVKSESEEALTALTILAGIYEKSGRNEDALQKLEAAESHRHAKNHLPLILHSKGRIQMKFSEVESAGKSLMKLSKLSLKDKEVQKGVMLLGDIDLSNGKYKSAYNRFKSVEKKAAAKIKNNALIKMGDAKLLLGEHGEALKLYNKIEISGLTPVEMKMYYFRRAYAAESGGDILNAVADYDKVLSEKYPDTLGVATESRKRAVALSLRMSDTEAAVSYCTGYLEMYPDGKERAYFAFRAGELYRNRLNETEKAVPYFKLVADNYGDNQFVDDALYELARSYFDLGLTREAADELKKIAELYPGSSQSDESERLLRYIDIFVNKESELGFERLAELMGGLITDKSRDELTIELASIYQNEMKDFERAAELLKKMISSELSDTHKSTALFMLGDINLKLAFEAEYRNDHEMKKFYQQQARSFLTELQSKFPNSENASAATYHLAMISNGSEEQKLRRLESFLNSFPESGFIDKALMSIGESYKAKGRLLKSRKLFETVLKEYPRSRESEKASFEIALLSQRDGSEERKRLDLDSYIRRYPGGKYVVRAKYLLGNSHTRSGNQSEAMDLYSDIVQNYYYSEYVDSVSSKLGMVYFEAGEYELALEEFLSSGSDESWFSKTFVPYRIPSNREEIYFAALSAEKSGNLKMAKSFYRRYLQRGTETANAPQAAFALLSIYEGEEGTQKTKPLLRTLLIESWSRAVAGKFHEMLADIYFGEKDYPLARSEYEMAKNLLPKKEHKRFILKILTCYFREEKFQDAERVEAAFKKEYLSSATADERALMLYERGMYLSKKELLPAAKRHFKEITKIFPKSGYGAAAGYELSLIEIAENKKQDALSRLSKLIDEYPDDVIIPQIQFTIGKLFRSVQQYNDAIEYLKKTIDHPDSEGLRETAYTELIRSYEESGLLEPALTTALLYIEKYSDSENAFDVKMKIGNLLMNVGDYEKAVKHWENLLPYADTETSSEILFWTGESYFNQGEYSRAITEYLKVSYLGAPTKLDWSASAWWKAGNAYEELGDYEKSALMYDRIIEEKGAVSDFGRYAQQRIESLRLAGKIEGG